MKNLTFLISIFLLAFLYGCSNVRFVQPREGCERGVFLFSWDICEGEDATPTLRQKIREDAPREAPFEG